MGKVEPSVRRAWLQHGSESVDLIIRVKGDVRQRTSALAERGVRIKRQFRLTSSLSVRCTGEVALALLDEPWVMQIEPDRPVRALGGCSHDR